VVIYLHGFASSPHSGKAAYLGSRLRAQGIDVEIPDLNQPDFSTLTITRMLDQTRDLMDRASGPVDLIGSSLGGFVALNAAARWPDRVRRIVLLAPAIDFDDEGLSGPGGIDLSAWKRAGAMTVFHFGYGRMMPIHYELYADARRYPIVDADLRMPILVFQGRRDTAVSPAATEAWARRRPNVELHLLDDGHQLSGSMELIWTVTSKFLGSPP
jgi:pimeloyl-ACP methyl ester carboxylesterase